MTYQKRIESLTEKMKDDRLDMIAIIPSPSMFYFTGLSFHLMERPTIAMFTANSEPRMLLPKLEQVKAKTSQVTFELFTYGEQEGEADATLDKAVSGLGLDSGRIGIEPLNMRYRELEMLRSSIQGAEFVPGDRSISSLRSHKDEAELTAMQEAAQIAETALAATLPLIKVGMTELELASELSAQLLRAGSEPETPFSPIVASGPNSAMGHATPSERTLSPGDNLILDWGAKHKGYVSDITRTFFVAEAPDELGKIHEIVQGANSAGRAAVRPGASCGSVDAAARGEIEAAGYGEFFGHRTGHGLGLEAHEPPFIRDGEQTTLEEGMTFTVEPGVYLPGRGGVRVEDDMVVTEEGGRSLTTFPREAQVVG